MDSLYFREPLGLLIEIASYKFEPPFGFSHGQVLEKAHEIRIKRGAVNIQDEDISLLNAKVIDIISFDMPFLANDFASWQILDWRD